MNLNKELAELLGWKFGYKIIAEVNDDLLLFPFRGFSKMKFDPLNNDAQNVVLLDGLISQGYLIMLEQLPDGSIACYVERDTGSTEINGKDRREAIVLASIKHLKGEQ